MNEFDVNILIPPARDECDDVTISGPRENVAHAINALNKRVDEIEAENEDKVGWGLRVKFPNSHTVSIEFDFGFVCPVVW